MKGTSLALTLADLALQDTGPEGPEHKKWREKLKEALRTRLREEGFTEHEIEKIILDALAGILGTPAGIAGIIRNLWRLYKARRAIRKAYKDAGPEPSWDK
jgi:hypothetical protein